jgi:hypothetical protein
MSRAPLLVFTRIQDQVVSAAASCSRMPARFVERQEIRVARGNCFDHALWTGVPPVREMIGEPSGPANTPNGWE